MPLFEDNKYHALFIGDMHPVKIMDGSKAIYEPKTLEQSGTSLTFSNTYNDYVDRLEIEGKTQEKLYKQMEYKLKFCVGLLTKVLKLH